MAEMLEKESRVFEANLPNLLAGDEGKFALVHDEEIAGCYESESDAVAEGYRRFGNVPFLVRQVSELEPTAVFVNDSLGL